MKNPSSKMTKAELLKIMARLRKENNSLIDEIGKDRGIRKLLTTLSEQKLIATTRRVEELQKSNGILRSIIKDHLHSQAKYLQLLEEQQPTENPTSNE